MQGGAALGGKPQGDVGEVLKGVGAAVSSCLGPGACSSVIIDAPESFQSRRGELEDHHCVCLIGSIGMFYSLNDKAQNYKELRLRFPDVEREIIQDALNANNDVSAATRILIDWGCKPSASAATVPPPLHALPHALSSNSAGRPSQQPPADQQPPSAYQGPPSFLSAPQPLQQLQHNYQPLASQNVPSASQAAYYPYQAPAVSYASQSIPATVAPVTHRPVAALPHVFDDFDPSHVQRALSQARGNESEAVGVS